MRELGRGNVPFFASISSISNHLPFRSPEPALDITRGDTAVAALHNTMHYTDDVVRELYETLRSEPWFDNTVLIITGDHGYDLGDRGESTGHTNLRHETTWVPLIVHGKDARLPRGLQPGVASHLDLAPTIVELAGVWDDNSYMGHSLLGAPRVQASALIMRSGHYAYETAGYGLYKPVTGAALVYRGDDLTQQNTLRAPPSGLLDEAERVARAHELLIAYTVDADRVAPRRVPSLAHLHDDAP
jgi:phosphoglycerol transferase MdoB-like AlkP superfamily enzyme